MTGRRSWEDFKPSGFEFHDLDVRAVPDILDAGPYILQGQAVRRYERLHAIMTAWHTDNHRGAYLSCKRQPCYTLNHDPKS